MNFLTKEPINKGWSNDKKYCITDKKKYCITDKKHFISK